MKYIYFFSFIVFVSCNINAIHKVKNCDCWSDTSFHSQGVTYVRLSDSNETDPSKNGLISSYNERVLKDTFIEWGDGSIPGKYWQVEYDYGRPMANEWQIIRWALGDSVPKCFNEWSVELRESSNFSSEEEYYDHKIISFYCPNHKSKLQKYSFDIFITKSKIEVVLNKDTINKYIELEYPYPDDRLRTRHDKK